MKILWVKPKKGKISVGRVLIVKKLSDLLRCDIEVVEEFNFITLRKILKSDIVIGTTRIGAIAVIFAKILGKKAIVDHVDPISMFNSPLKPLIRVLENLAFKLSDVIVISNEEDLDRVDKSKTIKTTLCIDYEKFIKCKSENKKNLVIYIGGLSDIYKIDILIESMKYLPDWKLLIIGEGKTFDINLNNVEFLGAVDHDYIPKIISKATVCITLCENPRQVKVLEYAAAGKPIVAPEGVLNTVALDSITPKSVANAIKLAALKQDDDKIRRNKHISKRHDINTVILHYLGAIRRCV